MKYKLKIVIVLVFMIVTLPFSLLALLLYRLLKSERAFAFFAQLFSLLPGLLGQYLRTSYYKITLEKCSYDVSIGIGSFFAHPSARVGRGVVITAYSIIGTADINDNVLISARVSILSGKYQHGKGITESTGNLSSKLEFTKVTIGKETWIGENSIVMESVGENCIVSAGSVVTKPMPANMIAIGNPARFLKRDY